MYKRQSIDSYRGPGLDKGLEMLAKIKSEYTVPVISDVHSPEEVLKAKEVVDVLQIPAFLYPNPYLVVGTILDCVVLSSGIGHFNFILFVLFSSVF